MHSTATMTASGYRSLAYAHSLDFIGAPLELPRSGGWLLRRSIAGSSLCDAMGVYPYLCCHCWHEVGYDFDALADRMVAVSAVTDPFGNYDAAVLARSFGVVRPYKPHYVIDTSVKPAQHVKRSHRETARRAMRNVSVSVADNPEVYADDWVRLYDMLCRRHGIAGLRRFTPEALRRQLRAPGLVMFRAEAQGRIVGLDLWYIEDGCAHGHLAAFDDEGYRLRASYATKMFLIEHFRQRVAWINLGATTGSDDAGLARFKSGWATGMRRSWLCGRIFDDAAYRRLMQSRGVTDDADFFPGYRRNEIF